MKGGGRGSRPSASYIHGMKNKVMMKAVLNYVGEVVVLGTIAFIVMFVYLHTLEAVGI